jgi:hypothetical protein
MDEDERRRKRELINRTTEVIEDLTHNALRPQIDRYERADLIERIIDQAVYRATLQGELRADYESRKVG